MDILVFDIETNGLGLYEPLEIVQIAGCKVSSGEEFSVVINPGEARFEVGAYALHMQKGRSPNWFRRNGLRPLLAMQRFREFVGEDVVTLAGHNVKEFDLPHLAQSLEMLGIDPLPEHTVLDTLDEAGVLKEEGKIPDRRLATLAKFYGVEAGNAHDALGDVRTTVAIIKAMRKEVI